ncbi:MAG: HlyD family secretion protein [Candidatus Protistobacter heckmanni]|nr:HlyD family secretion protein [Candidatus Protistobacter heckmanni]
MKAKFKSVLPELSVEIGLMAGRTRWRGGPAWLILAVLAVVAAFIGWSTRSNLDGLARAGGQVIAVARTQVVQAVDNGVLAALLVEEGQTVHQGDLLDRMDQSRASAAHQDSKNKVAALRATLARLRAEVLWTPSRISTRAHKPWSAFR